MELKKKTEKRIAELIKKENEKKAELDGINHQIEELTERYNLIAIEANKIVGAIVERELDLLE